jgi:hypothetical protein
MLDVVAGVSRQNKDRLKRGWNDDAGKSIFFFVADDSAMLTD